jgi:hypothetical protein
VYAHLDVARSLTAILGAVAASTGTSRTRDIDPAALDYGLSQRALTTISGRTDVVAELTPPGGFAALAHSSLQTLDEPTVRVVLRQAVRDVRIARLRPRRSVGGSHRRKAPAHRRPLRQRAIGELMLKVAPTYPSDTEAATGVIALLCKQISEPLEHGLTARRYAMSGDHRALCGTVL